MFIALLGRDKTGHRTEKVGTIISPTHLLLDSGLVGNIAEEEMLHLSKRWVRLDRRGFSKSLQRRRIQFPVLDPAKLTPSIKTSRRYIGSHINHSTLSSSDKAQSHPLYSTFIHFIHFYPLSSIFTGCTKLYLVFNSKPGIGYKRDGRTLVC